MSGWGEQPRAPAASAGPPSPSPPGGNTAGREKVLSPGNAEADEVMGFSGIESVSSDDSPQRYVPSGGGPPTLPISKADDRARIQTDVTDLSVESLA